MKIFPYINLTIDCVTIWGEGEGMSFLETIKWALSLLNLP